VSPKDRTYDFNAFLMACGNPESVLIKGSTVEDAKRDFNLNSRRAILDFIVAGGLKELSFNNSAPLQKDWMAQKEGCSMRITSGIAGSLVISHSFIMKNKSYGPSNHSMFATPRIPR